MTTRHRLDRLAHSNRCPTCSGSGVGPPLDEAGHPIVPVVINEDTRQTIVDLADRIALDHTPDDQVTGPLASATSTRDDRYADAARTYLAALDE